MSPRREAPHAAEDAEAARARSILDAEATTLLVFAVAAATAALGGSGGAVTLLPGTASLLLCLVWRLAAPRSWSRWRAPLLVTLRLLLAAPAAVPLLRLSRTRAAAPRAADVIDGPLGDLHFLFVFTVASGTAGLVLSCLGLRLPPLLGAAVQVVATVLVAAANPALCSTDFMQHPGTIERLEVIYAWLQPAFAPLEPLLWLAGIGPDHPYRRCYCVLAALQVWCGLLLPLALDFTLAGRWFRRYRLQRLQTLLAAQYRSARSQQRVQTRAAARRRREAAASVGVSLPPVPSSSSGPSSPESPSERQWLATQAEALAEAAALPGLLQPGDLQYELAYQAQLRIRALAGWPALLAAALLCIVYSWHVLTYG